MTPSDLLFMHKMLYIQWRATLRFCPPYLASPETCQDRLDSFFSFFIFVSMGRACKAKQKFFISYMQMPSTHRVPSAVALQPVSSMLHVLIWAWTTMFAFERIICPRYVHSCSWFSTIAGVNCAGSRSNFLIMKNRINWRNDSMPNDPGQTGS